MRRRPTPALVAGALCAAALAAPARVAAAQGGPLSPECEAQLTVARDGCQKAVDLFNYFAPQLAAMVAGGNVELGRGGALGGPGHFSVGVRATGLRSQVPQLQNVRVATTGARRSELPVDGAFLAFPVVDAAVGVFGGVPLGVTRAGAVDVLVSAAYVPTVRQDDVELRTSGGSVRLGYGARVGVLQESPLVPGVALSVLRRETPATSLAAVTDAGDRFGVVDARVRTDSWRLTASKNLVLFALAVGVGQDRARTRAAAEASIAVAGADPAVVRALDVTQRVTRRNYFANFTLLNLPFVKLVGEIGRSEGGRLPATYNSFGARRPDQAYTYASAGLRVGR
jgi:hypothetical protein